MTFRQSKIVDRISPCEILADVGCDHGIVGYEALKRGLCRQTVFIDVSFESLQKAVSLTKETPYYDRCEFLCQNGLKNVDADVAVIAGMGGKEIISILQDAPHKPRRLVLQPMKNARELRLYLSNAYYLETDVKIFDGKFYDIISASAGKDKLSDDELEFGKTNLSQPSLAFKKYLEKEIMKFGKISERCGDADVIRKTETLKSVYGRILRR